MRKTEGPITEDRFYHTDHLLEYDPWGRISRDDEQLDNVKKFTGQEFDEETELYYVARYYDPVLGRFQSVDPIVQAPFQPQNLTGTAMC